MEIVLASEMGFCFGVRRAVDMMTDATAQAGPMVASVRWSTTRKW